MSESQTQATLAVANEGKIDEYGEQLPYATGGAVLDETGSINLEATQKELASRFAGVDQRLPDEVGEYRRIDTPAPLETDAGPMGAAYISETPSDGPSGKRRSKLRIEIFPRGPWLHAWTVSLNTTYEEGGKKFISHPHARSKNNLGAAVSTALGVMRGEVSEEPPH